MSDDDTLRQVQLERVRPGAYRARNVRGGELVVAADGSADFTPVELLLVAIAACTAVDVDTVTSRRAEPVELTMTSRGHKVRDDAGNRLDDLSVTLRVRFPDGADGDAARAVLPRALAVSHDRTCTVSRTVEAGTAVEVRLDA